MFSFLGLNIAARGLRAQQTAMNVVGQNIANANTPGYHRQQVSMRALSLLGTNGSLTMGDGVDVSGIRRVQDSFLEEQLRGSAGTLGRYSAGKGALDNIVSVIGEPSDTGLSADLDKFWNSWQDLSLHSDNASSRSSVLAYGTAVAGSLNRLYVQVQKIGRQQTEAITSQVDEVNQIAAEVAGLNTSIQQATSTGGAPNDLMDQRDALLQQLSGLVGASVQDGGNTVTIGGRVLLQNGQSFSLGTGTDADGHTTVTWAEDGAAAGITGGQVAGALDIQHNTVPAYLANLDKIAVALRDRVNAVHSAGAGLDGVTGRSFFVGTGALDLAVNPDLVANPGHVAAGASGAAGDGSVARAIAAIKGEALVDGATINAAFGSFVARAGADAALMDDHLATQTQINQQLTVQQQSVSGVSLDEELSDMVRFQQSYNASARLFTAMDEMLSTVIDRLGTVGR